MKLIENRRRGKLRLPTSLELRSGLNMIEDAAWRECEQNPITMHYLARGDLIVVPGPHDTGKGNVCQGYSADECVPPLVHQTGPGTTAKYWPESPPLVFESPAERERAPVAPAGDSAPKNTDPWGLPVCIESMRVKEVIALTRRTDSVRTLRQLLTRDPRPNVVRAVEQRIAELRG